MSEERRAQSLARWLEQPPGTPPPPEVDPEVVEALYALRPERAPAPRLTADDILASVTSGPLAADGAGEGDAGSEEAEVLPFPGGPATDPSVEGDRPEPVPVRRAAWGWVGGASGLGLALVVAATLLLVASPENLQDLAAPTASEQVPSELSAPRPPDAADAPAAAAPEALEEEVAAAEPTTSSEAAPAARRDRAASTRTVSPEPQEQAKSAPAAEPSGVAEGPLPMRERTLEPEPSPIPELDGLAAGDAVAEAGEDEAEELLLDEEAPDPVALEQRAEQPPMQDVVGGVVSTGNTATYGSEVEDLDALRARAVPSGLGGWRSGLDGETAARFDEAYAAARGAAPGEAGDRLSSVVEPPARAGQQAAAEAVGHYLNAGDLQAALAVAQRGLALSSAPSPERAWLLVRYGDALRQAGDDDGAAQAWRDAITAGGGVP